MIGKTLAHYKIIEKLGSGGMGDVYAAEDTKLSRSVALKVLPPEMASQPERRKRFEREAKAVAALNHPNIVTLFSVEESEGLHFITIELVRGKALTALIPPKGLSLSMFLDIAIPLADAVSTAHEEGITHRDLKPDNVMVDDKGRPKVLDFGLAKLKQETPAVSISELPTESRTKEGHIVGTVAYMSPEQAEGKQVDSRTDIFSLGIVLYEMVTGRNPFKGDSATAILAAIMKDTPASVTDLNPQIPHDLGKLIRRCLEKNPDERLQTARDLRNELNELKRDKESGEASGTVIAASPSILSPKVYLAVAAIVVAAVAVTYWLVRPGRETEQIQTATDVAALTQLTFQSGVEQFPSLSPDGEFVIYESNHDIYLQRVDGENAINLTKDPKFRDGAPNISPDGKQIAFVSDRGDGGIFVMGATGESVKRITDFGFNLTWSPDGKFLAYSTKPIMSPVTTPENGKIFTVNIETGEKKAISGEYDAVQPHWSPHGRRIVYWSLLDRSSDIWTIPATGGGAVPVTDDDHVDWNPVWSPDGDFVYFLSDRGGTMSLWRTPIVEETGAVLGDPELVTTTVAAEMRYISISGDGRRLVYTAHLQTANLHRVSFDPSTERVVGQPVQITGGSIMTTWPDPSPDGEWVAVNISNFGSARGGLDIALVRPDGSDQRRLTNDAHRDRMPRWSPDGSRIAFFSNRSGVNLWSISSEGSNLQQLTNIQGGRVNHLAWSPDGLRIVINEGTTGSNYILAADKNWEEQTPQELPQLEGTFTANSWSPDGRFLAGRVRDSRTNYLTLFSLETQEYQRLQVIGSSPVWLSDSQRLLYAQARKLYLLDVESGNQHQVFGSDGIGGIFGVSSDDTEIYFSRSDVQGDIWMLNLAQEVR